MGACSVGSDPLHIRQRQHVRVGGVAQAARVGQGARAPGPPLGAPLRRLAVHIAAGVADALRLCLIAVQPVVTGHLKAALKRLKIFNPGGGSENGSETPVRQHGLTLFFRQCLPHLLGSMSCVCDHNR